MPDFSPDNRESHLLRAAGGGIAQRTLAVRTLDPLAELQQEIATPPCDKSIVAYCRGPFRMMAHKVMDLRWQRGYRALRLDNGVAEWRLAGLPVENDGASAPTAP